MIRRSWTERLFVACGRRPRTVFAATALVVILGALAASRLQFDPDVLHLLPSRDPAVETYRQTLAQFGTADYFVVAIRIPEGAPIDPYDGFADRLVVRMQDSKLFTAIEYRLGEPEELLRQFLPRSMLFLGPQERQRVAAKLGDEAIHRRIQELRRQLETPQAVAARDLLKLDPLGLAEIFVERLGGQRGPLAIDWTTGRYVSRDHRMMLVLAKPVRSPQDLAFNRSLVATMERDAALVRGDWQQLAAGLPLPPPEILWGGRYVITLEDTALIWSDVGLNVATSIGGVLVLFYLAYRRTSLLALVFSPLFCGLAITFGFAALAVGVLASTTAGVAALLVGLGVDFVIVLYGRYVAERRKGGSVEDALRAMGGATARGVVLGAVTTAATFYAFLTTDFTGLFQMGLIVGTGILFCLVATLLLVPAMIGWSEEHHRKREREPRLHIFAFGVERLTHVAIDHPRTTLGIAAALTVVAAALAPGIAFDDSVEALRPAGNQGVRVQQEINQHFGAGFDSMSLVIATPTLEETLAITDRAAAGARKLVSEGRLGGFDSVTSVLPSLDGQRESLDWLERERASGALDPARIRRTFEAACQAEGLRARAFEGGLDLLEQALTPGAPVTRAALAEMPQGSTLLDRYLRQTPEGWTSLIKIYNLPGRPKREIPEAAVELSAGLGSHARLTGINVMSRSLRVDVRRDATVSALIGLFLVTGLLWVDFRSLRTALLALLPLSVGLLWMVGAMVVLDLHFNFMNIFVITMILGIGVDYGIHVIHRCLEEREAGGDVQSAIEETVRGVLLAALTTVVGFGSLATSHYPGLVSMGLVSTIGTVATALIAITVVPAWLFWRSGRSGRRT